ncbi:MAG: hypothetical protein ACKOWJ_01030, partial [Micrococcales bacterium]
MKNCARCGAEIKTEKSCTNCNPFTFGLVSRNATIFIAGLLTIAGLWFALFAIGLLGMAVAVDFGATQPYVGELPSASGAVG